MDIKTLNNIRFTPKGDTEANWNKAVGFIPLEREIIIYKPDENHSTARIKIGDGVTPVTELPFESNLESGKGLLSIQQSLNAEQVDFSVKDSEGHTRNDNAIAFDNSLATVFDTGATGPSSASLNGNTIALGSRATAINNKTIAKGDESLAQGYQSVAYGGSSFAGGNKTFAGGSASVALGSETQAIKDYAFAEGKETSAEGEAAHAEGYRTKATHNYAHASGNNTVASGESSYAGGVGSIASGNRAFAHGEGALAEEVGQIAVGISNESDPDAIFMVGNGDYDDSTLTAVSRQTAFKVMKDGRAKLQNKKIQAADDIVTKEALENEIAAIDTITYITIEIPTDNYVIRFYSLPGATKVDWGDGTVNQAISHRYTKSGTYQCKVYDLHTIAFNQFGPDSIPALIGTIKAVNISNTVQVIANFGLYNTDIQTITIPPSVRTIGELAFSECSSLTSVVIPDSVTAISRSTFNDCASLTSVVIPDSVTSIALGAFYCCSSLTSIEIPDSVNTIGSSAFENCTSLTRVVIKSAKLFNSGIGNSTFNNIAPNAEIIFESPVPITFSGGYGHFVSQDTITIKVPTGCVDAYKAAWKYDERTGALFPPELLDNIVENTYRNSFEIGNNSLTAGNGAVAKGNNSIASGEMTWAGGSNSTAFGQYSVASGYGSHTEGDHTEATADYAHAEGSYTKALNSHAHSEGQYTEASGIAAHAEGYHARATGNYTHASGYYTDATRDYQTAVGKFNRNCVDTLFEVGNGTNYTEAERSNAFEVYKHGGFNAYGDSTISGKLTVDNFDTKKSNLYMFFDKFTYSEVGTGFNPYNTHLKFQTGFGGGSLFWAKFQRCVPSDKLSFRLLRSGTNWVLEGGKNIPITSSPTESYYEEVAPQTESSTSLSSTPAVSVTCNGPNIVYVSEDKHTIKFFVKPEYSTAEGATATYSISYPGAVWALQFYRNPEDNSVWQLHDIEIDICREDGVLSDEAHSHDLTMSETTLSADGESRRYYKYMGLVSKPITPQLDKDAKGYTTKQLTSPINTTTGIPLLFGL